MNVLHILPAGDHGGGSRIVSDWITHGKVNNQILVGGGGPVADQFEDDGKTVHRLRLWRPRNVWGVVNEAAEIVRREKIDILHSFSYDGHLLGGLLRWRTGCPEVWFNHGPIERVAWSRFARFLPTDRVLVASRSMAKAQRRGGYWGPGIHQVPLGINSRHFSPRPTTRTRVRERLGITHEVCILVPSRIDPQKGQAVLLRAAAKLKRRQPNMAFHLFLVGGKLPYQEAEEYETMLQSLVSTSGLEQQVTFTGHVTQIEDYYAAADLVVVPSTIQEGFCLAVVEGMAMERVVIGPKAGGPAEIISDHQDGYLCPPGDHDALCTRLESCIQDLTTRPERFSAVASAARRTVMNKYTIERSTHALEQNYRRVLGQRGGQGSHRPQDTASRPS